MRDRNNRDGLLRWTFDRVFINLPRCSTSPPRRSVWSGRSPRRLVERRRQRARPRSEREHRRHFGTVGIGINVN